MNLGARAVSLLGSRPLASVSRTLLGGHRILAYHGVSDASTFAAQMRHVKQAYQPVGDEEIVRAHQEGSPLPSRAVWVTFDDGDPSVVTRALPVLEELGIPAIMFVCPGLIEGSEPFWWDIVEAAVAARVTISLFGREWGGPSSLAALKTVDDRTRRMVIAELAARVEEVMGAPVRRRQLTIAELHRWQAAGQTVGNHTWDHPCLDTCAEPEQAQQVRSAHDWLQRHLSSQRLRLFAYPNGNWASSTEQVLRTSGYDLALGFDHRLASRNQHPLRVSRLRVSSDAPLQRFRSILSGAHPALYDLAGRVRRTHREDPRRLPTA